MQPNGVLLLIDQFRHANRRAILALLIACPLVGMFIALIVFLLRINLSQVEHVGGILLNSFLLFGLAMPLVTLLLLLTLDFLKYYARHRFFATPPFNQLRHLGFREVESSRKKTSLFQGKIFKGVINGYPVIIDNLGLNWKKASFVIVMGVKIKYPDFYYVQMEVLKGHQSRLCPKGLRIIHKPGTTHPQSLSALKSMLSELTLKIDHYRTTYLLSVLDSSAS